MSHRLDPLLQPRSIAMVGASNNPGRIGGMPLDLLRHFHYAGEVYPINPKYEEVFGYRCFPDVEALPSAPDLVVLAIAAEDVTDMLERCHAKGIRAAIVYAAGFAEAGSAGEELQAKLEQFAQRTGMAIAGPNCMGFANINNPKGLLIALAAVLFMGSWKQWLPLALVALVIHIAIDRLQPVLGGGGGDVTLPPLMEESFWTQALVLFLGYLVIIGIFYFLKSLLFRKAAH